jgi:acetyltransferase
MTIYNLDKIFRPSSVAVVGASEKEGSIGLSLVENLKAGGFEGRIFPVNSRYDSIKGLKAYPSLADTPHQVDLAIVATPINRVPAIIKECGKFGIGGAVVISAGGKEVGDKGRMVEASIEREARKAGVRIIGPNCMGIICAESGINASFSRAMPMAGKLAFISQSGAICAAILDISAKKGIGFSHFVSIGSMLDVDFGDLIDYLGHDPEVRSIVLYIESLTRIRKFMSACRAVSRIKPIVVLKAGRSSAGARAAASHTGALAGEDAVYDAAFKRAGVVRVDTIEELFDCAELISKQPLPAGPEIAIVTNGGGPGVMAADALAAYRMEPATLTEETIETLDRFLPPFWSRGNPIDILGDATPDRWKKALEACLSAREISSLVIIFVPQALTNAVTVAEAVLEVIRNRPFPPLFAVWMGGENVDEARQLLNSQKIPTYDTPERAIAAFRYMVSHARNLEMLQEIPPQLPGSLNFDHAAVKDIIGKAMKRDERLLPETQSKAILQAYGIPVNRTEKAESPHEAVHLARDMGYPVAMKIVSPHIVHKSDAHCVTLDLKSGAEVKEAFQNIMASAKAHDPKARLLGVSIQPMLKRPECELIMGAKRDPQFGPVILFGMGGIMTEIIMDRALALPPLNRLLARRLMENTKVCRVLKGYRNQPGADMGLLEEILIRLSQLVTDFPEIHELDINPMYLQGHEAFAVDARIVLGPARVSSPRHLVISPYPNQYEMRTSTKEGREILVRPIKPEDAPLLTDLHKRLSPQTIYYRFFTPMKSLPKKILARFTQIDYDRDMALVAIDETGTSEKMLGVARLMSEPGGEKAEFAVLVDDAWQGKGVGGALMERLIQIGRERGIESLWGLALPENRHMIALGRKLGFSVSKMAGENLYELKIVLGPLKSQKSAM